MSDILNRQIAERMQGDRIDVAGLGFGVDDFTKTLADISRLTAALSILYPGEQQAGEPSIDCAIRLLERAK